MKRIKLSVAFFAMLIMGIFSFSLFYTQEGGITGFAIFNQGDLADFNEGTYDNTEYNGTGVMLEYLSDSVLEMPDNKADDWMDMSGNVLLMHMNEASGAIADTSGENNDGTTHGGAVYGVDGKLGSALNFDGVDDYVQTSFISGPGNEFTVSAWSKPNEIDDGYLIWHLGSYGYLRYHSSNQIEVYFPGGCNEYLRPDIGEIQSNEWHHFVYSYQNDSGNGKMKIYYEGNLIHELEKNCSVGTNSDNVDIGARSDSLDSRVHNGTIDEVAIWNRALSDNEILTLYQKQTETVGYGGGESGSYTSEIFDASSDTHWNNISWESQTKEASNLYLSSAIHLDINRTDVFNLDGIYYSVDMKDSSKNFNFNFSENLINGTILKFYAKADNGLTIGIYAQTDSSGTNPLGTFTVDSPTGDWYNATLDITTPTNAIWIGEGTGSGTDPKDEFDYIYAEIPGTDLNLTVRSCDDNTCSGESFTDIADTSPQNLNVSDNRYFQYKFNFETDDYSCSPELYNVTIDYNSLGPSVSIITPCENETFNYNTSLPLNFIITNSTPTDSCWYNINNGENTTISNCENTTFNLGDGEYELYLYVNDSFGEIGDDNVNFIISAIGVHLSISEPSSTKSSRTEIPITYTATGNNLTCWYSVQTSIGGSVIDNTTLENCSGSNFDVSSDGDYVLNLYANNSLGAFNSKTTAFTVDTSSSSPLPSPPSSSSGGGSGGGSSYIIQSEKSKLEIKEIGNIIIYPGEEKIIELSVKNMGKTSVNKCKLNTKEEYSTWIESDDLKNIGVGEIVEFRFILKIPESVSTSGHINPEINLECIEENMSVPLNIILINPVLDLNISQIDIISKTELRIKYTLESDTDTETTLIFSVYSGQDKISEKIQEIKIRKSEKLEKEIILDISDAEPGLLKILVVKSGDEKPLVDDSIIYGSQMITGFISKDILTSNISYITLIVVVFCVPAFFIIRRILRLRKNNSSNK